jgi:hypothetical protein
MISVYGQPDETIETRENVNRPRKRVRSGTFLGKKRQKEQKPTPIPCAAGKKANMRS